MSDHGAQRTRKRSAANRMPGRGLRDGWYNMECHDVLHRAACFIAHDFLTQVHNEGKALREVDAVHRFTAFPPVLPDRRWYPWSFGWNGTGTPRGSI